MAEIKKIIVFSTSDSRKLSSWSNVPYLFTETLMMHGLDVTRVHVKEIAIFAVLYRVIKKILTLLFGFHTSFEYSRSLIHFYYSKWFMERVLNKNDFDAVLILSFSYAPAVRFKKPVILFGDWSYEYYLKYFLNRSPDRLEINSVNRENAVLEQADFIFVLFPVACTYLLEKHNNKNIHYLGNVINAIEEPGQENLILKKASNSIVFVGKEHYLEGAKQLIEVFSALKKDKPNLRLDIIGMGKSFFSDLPEGVVCHGYLDKGKERDRKLYYDLLKNARVFINTTPKWASFSAALEAMHFYTPVITTSYPEFVKTFGNEINFGYFYNGGNQYDLASLIKKIFTKTDYEVLCINAHAAVKDFTWDSYVKKFVQVIGGH